MVRPSCTSAINLGPRANLYIPLSGDHVLCAFDAERPCARTGAHVGRSETERRSRHRRRGHTDPVVLSSNSDTAADSRVRNRTDTHADDDGGRERLAPARGDGVTEKLNGDATRGAA